MTQKLEDAEALEKVRWPTAAPHALSMSLMKLYGSCLDDNDSSIAWSAVSMTTSGRKAWSTPTSSSVARQRQCLPSRRAAAVWRPPADVLHLLCPPPPPAPDWQLLLRSGGDGGALSISSTWSSLWHRHGGGGVRAFIKKCLLPSRCLVARRPPWMPFVTDFTLDDVLFTDATSPRWPSAWSTRRMAPCRSTLTTRHLKRTWASWTTSWRCWREAEFDAACKGDGQVAQATSSRTKTYKFSSVFLYTESGLFASTLIHWKLLDRKGSRIYLCLRHPGWHLGTRLRTCCM